MRYALRPYQIDDRQSVIDLWQSKSRLLGRAATGLGKTVLMASLCEHIVQQGGKCLVLADTGVLVDQLARSIEKASGIPVCIEKAGERAKGWYGLKAPIVVGTVQTQFSGDEGDERMQTFEPGTFDAVLLDECEFFLAPKYRKVVDWHLDHPKVKMLGVTATPLRSDGQPMSELFEAVAFDRDYLWAVANGWLVPVKQGFLRVSVELGSSNRRPDGDYTDRALAERLEIEQAIVEIGKGITEIIGDRLAITVAPRVATAQAITDYLNGQADNFGDILHGKIDDFGRRDVLERFSRREFRSLQSVSMLTKGFDEPQVSVVNMCRPTRSKRLYAQVMGRATRPLAGVLDGIDSVEGRLEAIANSAKPDALMVNLVGIDEEVRDIQIVDILGESKSEEVRERAKKKALDGEEDPDAAIEDAEAEISEEKIIAEEMEKAERAQLMQRVEVRSISQDWYDPTKGTGPAPEWEMAFGTGVVKVLKSAKVPAKTMNKLMGNPDEAKRLSREIVRRWKKNLCSFRQGQMLRQHGFTKEQIAVMTFSEASAHLDQIFSAKKRRAS